MFFKKKTYLSSGDSNVKYLSLIIVSCLLIYESLNILDLNQSYLHGEKPQGWCGMGGELVHHQKQKAKISSLKYLSNTRDRETLKFQGNTV